MAYAKIKYELEDAVALITLNDPATLNAIAVDMTAELTDAFGRAVREARCIVMTGEGRAFSSGANLASGAPPTDADGQPDLGDRLEEHQRAIVGGQAHAGAPRADREDLLVEAIDQLCERVRRAVEGLARRVGGVLLGEQRGRHGQVAVGIPATPRAATIPQRPDEDIR